MTLFRPPEPDAWVLWHRETRRHKWRVFATGRTAADALGAIRGKGEWMLIGEPSYDPNETCLADVQRAAKVTSAA